MARRRLRPVSSPTTPASDAAAEHPTHDISGDALETRVFRSGNSDAVRLPIRWGLAGKLVRLRPLTGGRVLVEPKARRRWPIGFLTSFGQVTPDFAAEAPHPFLDAEEDRAIRRFSDDT